MIGRRGLITGLMSLVAAPAIVRAASLMPVKPLAPILVGCDVGAGDCSVWAVEMFGSEYGERWELIRQTKSVVVGPSGGMHITLDPVAEPRYLRPVFRFRVHSRLASGHSPAEP